MAATGGRIISKLSSNAALHAMKKIQFKRFIDSNVKVQVKAYYVFAHFHLYDSLFLILRYFQKDQTALIYEGDRSLNIQTQTLKPIIQ